MENCGSMFKRVLVVTILVAAVQSGLAAEKLASCCKTVNKKEITETITGYLVQRPNPPCVKAVIFQTKSGLFCSQLNAPWVLRKIVAFRKEKAQSTALSMVPSSTASLLSVITSTAFAPSSAMPPSPSSSPSSPSSLPASPSSLPSTSEMPAAETFSETATSSIFSTSGQ